ncbi:MAG: S-layer homology domain-containing protein [Eubacteriales bacterium]|nr:S-layer homology domain-containing protein [Eubacteriales bacterium]
MGHGGKRLLAAALACGCLLTATAGAAGSVTKADMAIGGTMVYLEMGAGRTGEVTLAGGRLFRAQDALAHRAGKAAEPGKTVVASINGGYFDAYSSELTTYATVIDNGEVINGGGNKPTLAFTGSGTPLIDRVKIESKVSFRDTGAGGTTVTAYAVDRYDAGDRKNGWMIALITPYHGRAIAVAPDARIVTMRNSEVTDIRVGGTVPALPWGTNVLIINSSAWNGLAQYTNEPQIGNAAIRSTVYTPQTDAADKWTNVVNGVGAGPLLLKNGVDVCDQNTDFTDPKQRPDFVSARSFAAIMGDGRLVLGSARSASMRQIAAYLKGLGAVDAMALDGGASTFLDVGGDTVHRAGRALSNVLHIVDHSAGTLPQGVQPRDFDTPSGWAADTLRDAAAAGIVPTALQRGYQKNITRKEFCQLIGALLTVQLPDLPARLYQTGITYDQARAALTDTFDADVMKCYQLGIINGTGGNKFRPNDSLTREQAAKIVMGAHQVLAGADARPAGSVSFADGGSIAGWAQPGVQYVVANGLMNGTGNDRFSPQGRFTREQAIATLYRML